MGTQTTHECDRIVEAIKEIVSADVTVECEQDFDTKDYVVWLDMDSGSRRVRFAVEEYQDRNWKQRINRALDEAKKGKQAI